jgi:hypothetical protein
LHHEEGQGLTQSFGAFWEEKLSCQSGFIAVATTQYGAKALPSAASK